MPLEYSYNVADRFGGLDNYVRVCFEKKNYVLSIDLTKICNGYCLETLTAKYGIISGQFIFSYVNNYPRLRLGRENKSLRFEKDSGEGARMFSGVVGVACSHIVDNTNKMHYRGLVHLSKAEKAYRLIAEEFPEFKNSTKYTSDLITLINY
jgi:hypothetical protein